MTAMPLPLLLILAFVAWTGAALVLATVTGARWHTAKPHATHTPNATPEEGTHA